MMFLETNSVGCDASRLFERFDERARSAVAWAQEEARTLGHGRIGSEHILLGLIVEDPRFEPESLAAQALKSLDITAERVRTSVLQLTAAGEQPTTGSIPLSADGKAALERALLESRRLRHDWVGPGHILLALGRDSESVAARMLLDLGADPENVWVTLQRLYLASGGRSGLLVQSTKAQTGASTVASGISVAFSAQVRRLGMTAAARALDDGRSEMEIEDLFLALTSETFAPLLADLGIDAAAVRASLERRREARKAPHWPAEG